MWGAEWVMTGTAGVLWAVERFWWSSRREIRGSEPKVLAFAALLFPWLLLFSVSKAWIVEPFRIPSASMAPGLEAGDYVLASKYAYGLTTPWGRFFPTAPKTGEVAIFECPGGGGLCVKRVIAIGGDVVIVGARGLFVNGRRVEATESKACRPGQKECVPVLTESWQSKTWKVAERPVDRKGFSTPQETFGDACERIKSETVCRVPEGFFFAMGDNRGESEDSRFFGFVEMRALKGRAEMVFFSQNNFGRLGGL